MTNTETLQADLKAIMERAQKDACDCFEKHYYLPMAPIDITDKSLARNYTFFYQEKHMQLLAEKR